MTQCNIGAVRPVAGFLPPPAPAAAELSAQAAVARLGAATRCRARVSGFAIRRAVDIHHPAELPKEQRR